MSANSAALDDASPTICLYHTGDDWDHYLIFAMTEINSGMYNETLGDVTFQPKYLYSNPNSLTVGGETQDVFSSNYESCHLFVGPAWTSQLSAIGEWAGIKHKPILSGGATSPMFAQDNFAYVSRSIPSELNVLEAIAQLLVEYKLTLINIVYTNDDFGMSLVEALTDLADDRFEIQLLRAFDSSFDLEDINSILNDLEASPTHITFLGMTVVYTSDFLNAAGARGMHSNHLWLSPTATQVADELDPPSTGGIWGISYGENLTNESSLAQRYLTKDLTPHIEAQEYGFKSNYDSLTYFGAYAYDAVLAAAHGLVATLNRSDGEELLRQIRDLSVVNGTTGVLKFDDHGDRIGARIPVFFVTPEGTSEQFAVYHDGNIDLYRDPLWPGGSITQPTDLIREDFDCSEGFYYSKTDESCFECPSLKNIMPAVESMKFEGVSKTQVMSTQELSIRNGNDSPVNLQLKSIPPFVSYSGSIGPAPLQAGYSISLEFISSSENLLAGVAVGEVVLGVTDVGSYSGCVREDIRVIVEVTVSPEQETIQLGGISAVGYTLSALVILASIFVGAWTFKHRKKAAVMKMQPLFLYAIIVGVLFLGIAMIPLSIDDGIASERGCDVTCMMIPWLLSMGTCIVFSALFSKLWRINRVLGAGHRRLSIKEKDVILPAAVMFGLNFIVLICWTAISPLRWERVPVSDEPWSTFGICASENEALEMACWIAIGLINSTALILTCWQVYKARNHPEQYSEAKSIGIAMYTWFQLVIVGIPVLLLIDQDHVTARYFFTTVLVFLICISLLCSVFVPILRNKKESEVSSRGKVSISGLDTNRVGKTMRSSIESSTTT